MQQIKKQNKKSAKGKDYSLYKFIENTGLFDSHDQNKKKDMRSYLIQRFTEKPLLLFQNIIFANYNSLDEIINHKRNRA